MPYLMNLLRRDKVFENLKIVLLGLHTDSSFALSAVQVHVIMGGVTGGVGFIVMGSQHEGREIVRL
jgi:hypothetical protein